MEKIIFKKDEEKITITIPVKLLKHIADNNPEEDIKVIDEQKFADKVAYELEHCCESSNGKESGMTGLEELVDRAIMEVVESGDPCVDLIEK